MFAFFKNLFRHSSNEPMCDGPIRTTESAIYDQLKEIIDAAVEVNTRVITFPDSVTPAHRAMYDDLIDLAGRVGESTIVLKCRCGIELTHHTDSRAAYIYINNIATPLIGVAVYADKANEVVLLRPLLNFIDDIGSRTIELRDGVRSVAFAAEAP